jgi:hypothetical protein
MTPQDRLRISILAARYQEALERDDHAALAALWELAAGDPELLAAFRQTHAGLIEELDKAESQRVTDRVAELAEKHLIEAGVVRPATGPVTIADVAEELFRHTPDRLPAVAHELNERLRSDRDPMRTDLGLSDFVAWAEENYGSAPAEYWKAFRDAGIKLELRRAAEAENYQLAARRAPKPGEGKP